MTYVDFKYTSLFWKLGYVEEITDMYVKKYSDSYYINIEAEKQEIDYQANIKPIKNIPTTLFEHKDFVVLECVNRLLEKGYTRKYLHLNGNTARTGKPDVIIYDKLGDPFCVIDCKRWGKDFKDGLVEIKKGKGVLFSYLKNNKETRNLCLYTSRLDGGLLEYKQAIISSSNIDQDIGIYFSGIFNDSIKPYQASLSLSEKEQESRFKRMELRGLKIQDINDFQIEEGMLIKYLGNSEKIKVPDNITNIGTGAFWNCTSLVSVEIPKVIRRIGGDAFYYCTNLKHVNIPISVEAIGNDPFAGCPLLKLTNHSPNFILEDGVLYNKTKTNIIHYPINKLSKTFVIPSEVTWIEKHAFYNCSNLTSITIPSSLICIENNVFAGCKNLKLINNSPNFILENGVLYNKEKTQLISLIDFGIENLVIPSSAKTIGKNAFWKCKNLKSLTIPDSVTRIGYNPFSGCNSLVLNNESPYFILEKGVLYNKEKTELIYCPNTRISESLTIPSSVKIIGRNSFSCCINLVNLVVPDKVSIIERGAFSGCKNLSSIIIPESVKSIGRWAFSYCESLKNIRLSENIKIEDYTFAESSVKITFVS